MSETIRNQPLRESQGEPPMKPAIANGMVVTLHYRLALDDGSIAEDTFNGEPLSYVQGTETLLPGLERALLGKEAGAEYSLRVPAADGYGPLDPDAEHTVERSQFPAGIELEPGMSFQAAGANAAPVWVQRVTGDEVVLTDNHPLAGEDLCFQIQILGVRQATEEDLAPPDT